MRVAILGASGMVGKGVLLECLDDARVDSVLVVGRRSCGVAHRKLEEVLHADFFDFSALRPRLASLDAPLAREERDDGGLADQLGRTDAGLERVEDALWIEQLAGELSPREREVLRLRFVEDLVQREIAERVGVSQMHVSRILRDALAQLASAA